jgi:hypothetical protein
MISIKDLKPQDIIYIKDKDDIDILFELLHENGYKWIDDSPYNIKHPQFKYKNNKYFYVLRGICSDIAPLSMEGFDTNVFELHNIVEHKKKIIRNNIKQILE